MEHTSPSDEAGLVALAEAQRRIMEIDSDELASAFLPSEILRFAAKCKAIIELICIASEFRPRNCRFHALFLKRSFEFIPEPLKDDMLEYLLKSLLSRHRFTAENIKNSIPVLRLFRECVSNGLIGQDALIREISSVINSPTTDEHFLSSLFIWVAPDLDRLDHSLYTNFLEKACHSNYEFFNDIDYYSSNRWEILLSCLSLGGPKNSLSAVIQADDVNSLSSLAASSDFDPNLPLQDTLFNFNPFRPRLLTPVEYSAVCGSEKCFKFLFLSTTHNFDNKTIKQLSICGGSLVIYTALKPSPSADTIDSAVSFHNYSVFESLASRLGKMEPRLIDSLAASSVRSSNFTALLFCLRNGASIHSLCEAARLSRIEIIAQIVSIYPGLANAVDSVVHPKLKKSFFGLNDASSRGS